MKCPTDNATLVMSERSGVEIDYCPECRGVWLDRGELDKILDRLAAEAPAGPPADSGRQYTEPRQPEPRQPDPRYSEPHHSEHQYRRDSSGPYRKKKKEHWLMEMFD
ncbi:zf-TFIIB domain-containing protein [Aeromicrobium sp. CF4.19]|uniref:TFIIB-type zinc ribbon-containing protein n=1 Tax=Aeromicrobium sp. CF4.19 TaxID=3373082 RepID=UPI003EE73FBB